MALIHPHQGSCASFSSTTKYAKCKPLLSLGRLDAQMLPGNHCCQRGPSIFQTAAIRLKVSVFKGSAQKDEAGRSSNGSKVSKRSVQLSYVPHDEEIVAESPEILKTSSSYGTGEENVAQSSAIHKLFKKWLIMLQKQSSNLDSNGTLGNGVVQLQDETSEGHNGSEKQEKGKLLIAAWFCFWELDSAIKIPLLIFIPWYLAVNMVYGAVVAKELTPLWVFGPLIVALYSKILQGLCALYIFSFRQTLRALKNLPNYYQLAYNIVARTTVRISTTNMNYKKLLEKLKEWAGEKYLDFVEFLWPYCCRTVRLLKSSNFI